MKQRRKQISDLNLGKKQLEKDREEVRRPKTKKDPTSSLLSILLKGEKGKFTVEDTIPCIRMSPEGICQLDEENYSRVISFQDISYRLALEEDRDLISNQSTNLLNSFDPNIHIELSCADQLGRNEDLRDVIKIADGGDFYDDIRKEFREMLKLQLAKDNNGLKEMKYIILTTEVDNLEQTRAKLNGLKVDILSNFKSMGVRAESLDGEERLRLVHDMLDPDKNFYFSYKDLRKRESTKSHMTLNIFNFVPVNSFKFGRCIGAVSHFQILASELSDRMLSEFLDIDDNIYVAFHVDVVEQAEAIKLIERKNTDLDRMRVEEQKKAVRAGCDMDIIPSDISTFGADVKSMLSDLQDKDERLFIITIVMMNFAKTNQKLENTIAQISSIANRRSCQMKRLSHQQEQGFVFVLPLGVNQVEIKRFLTPSSTAVFMSSTTEELFIDSANFLYYGLNALNQNLIMADERKLENPNGLILGTSGPGKSFSAEREMASAILVTDDDIIICGPEGEYSNFVKQLDGEVIKVSAKSKDYLNLLDINMDYGDESAPLKDKVNFIMSMLGLVVGGSDLTAAEKSVIDRCLPKIYQEYSEDPKPKNMPILGDLYDMLLSQEEGVGRKLTTEMEVYIKGSLNVFSNRSNADLNRQLLCFDIKELGTQLKKVGMLVIQDQIWNKVSLSRGNKSTRYYVDEFHLLLKDPQTASYLVEIWKRFRKWGDIPTGITQNVKDLLISQEVGNTSDSTSFVLVLNQASGDRDILAKKLKISPYQLNYIISSDAGEGLLLFGNTIVPFIDRFPKDTMLYKLVTTKPEGAKWV